MTGCMTEMGIENNWAILGKQRQSWVRFTPGEFRLSPGLAHHQGSAVWCLCREENRANEEMREEGRSLAGNSCGGDWKEEIAEK